MANPIPVLWFTPDRGGPDALALQLHHFPAELDGRIPAWLGLRVKANLSFILNAGPMIGGGFNLHRNQVVELHGQLGAWLAANPEVADAG